MKPQKCVSYELVLLRAGSQDDDSSRGHVCCVLVAVSSLLCVGCYQTGNQQLETHAECL